MYNQSFTAKELYSCVTQAERRDLGLNKEDFMSAIDTNVVQKLNQGRFRFTFKEVGGLLMNGNKKEYNAKLYQDIVLRKLHRNIVRIYNVKLSNRNQIIEHIISLLSENVPLTIIRLDVRHFYNSINRSKLIDKILNDCRLSPMSIHLIRQIDKVLSDMHYAGLPQGLSISTALSELYMKYFDLEIQHFDGVYYFGRYVDDIIIFCSSESLGNKVWERIPILLSEIDLELNKKKSYILSPVKDDSTLTYLGYVFNKNSNKLKISIAESKIKKIKTRITKAFINYSVNHNFDLLLKRIKFLTGNFMLYSHSTLSPIMTGIYFNYKKINEKYCLKDIDIFYQHILHYRSGSLGRKMALTKTQVSHLEKYSFQFGFDNHVRHYFSSVEMGEIKKCWK